MPELSDGLESGDTVATAEFETPVKGAPNLLTDGEPSPEFETPVKGPKHVRKLLPRPVGARPGGPKLPAGLMTLSDVEGWLGQFQLPPKYAEAVLAELANGPSDGDVETHSVCNRKC